MLIVEANALSTLLTQIGQIITSLITNAGAIFDVMNEHPVAYIGIAASVVFMLVRFVKSILNF